MSAEENNKKGSDQNEDIDSVQNFTFHDTFPVESNNGLYFNDIYVPEEMVVLILSYIDAKEILTASLVCQRWCNIIKSDAVWILKYNRLYKNKKAKNLPWYVFYSLFATKYFDNNLIKNGNGEEQFLHWKIINNYGDEFRIEDPPVGADPLPLDIPEFNGKTSCFATSFYECNKLQEISLRNNKLMQLILNQYKPHIYLSDWVAGRFDCGCIHDLFCRLYGEEDTEETDYNELLHGVESGDVNGGRHNEVTYIHWSRRILADAGLISNPLENTKNPCLLLLNKRTKIEQWAGSAWSKVELVAKDYPDGVQKIVFQHEGRDTLFWKGHYGSKMAGSVLRIVFDSMETKETCEAVEKCDIPM